jgi:hypothetical protein
MQGGEPVRQIFNIPKKDLDIKKHLELQDNISRYIIKLIREDMKKPSETEGKIREYIEKYLQEKKNTLSD